MSRVRRVAAGITIAFVTVLTAGYAVPMRVTSPVSRADIEEINPKSFWHYPWSRTGAHRGIDIFCQAGTPVVSPVTGFVFRSGYGSIAGNYLYIGGAGWRSYYVAHLDTVFARSFQLVHRGDTVGRAGTTGNAVGTPAHVHYSIRMLLPWPSQFNPREVEAWSRTFYLDPTTQLGFETASFARTIKAR